MAKINKLMRSDPEFRKLINRVKANRIMSGKKPLRTAEITKMIARKIKLEDLIEDEIIRF